MSSHHTCPIAQLTQLKKAAKQQLEALEAHDPRPWPELVAAIEALIHTLQQADSDYALDGQTLVSKIKQHYPELDEALDSELLWFFAGDCLHWLQDEELTLYQRLDEKRHQALEDDVEFDYEQWKLLIQAELE